jgi:hypothetical protein
MKIILLDDETLIGWTELMDRNVQKL